nr:CPBP family intramembrane glutamic endopeptidase [Chryseolinea lacunae]
MGEHHDTTLLNTIDAALSWPILSACLVLLAFTVLTRHGRAAGLTTPFLHGAWLLIYPAVVITTVLIHVAFGGGFNNADNFKWILVNTALVGFSEEMMFRGYVFGAHVGRIRFLWVVVLVSVFFGGVHVLNTLVTGQLRSSVAQAVMAAFSGLLFLAIRVKTRSLVPAMVVHGLFDFSVMMNLSVPGNARDPWNAAVGVLLALSPLIFGITGIVVLSNKETVNRFLQSLPEQDGE